MNKFRDENNPRGYWGTDETGWSHSWKLLVYLAETRYPDFNPRYETFTKPMQREVMRLYNMFVSKDEQQDDRQVNLPLRLALNKRVKWNQDKFDWNDEQYVKYKKELNNR